jgi:hypothetical protein
VEPGVAEAEHASVRGHQPVAGAVGSGGHADESGRAQSVSPNGSMSARNAKYLENNGGSKQNPNKAGAATEAVR